MTRVKLELDTETFGRLVESAVAERRPVDMQAEVVLMRALGLRDGEEASSATSKANVMPTEAQVDEAIHALA
jgi:hypothetical protein